MKIKQASDKANEALEGVAAKVERAGLTKWILVALAVVLLIAIGLWASKARATGYEHGGGTSISGAVAGAVSGSYSGGGSASASTGGVNISERSYGFGAPSVGNGPLNCEVVLPILGGSAPLEREACATVRDARAIFDLIPVVQERDAAVKALLCKTDRIKEAFAKTSRPCKD